MSLLLPALAGRLEPLSLTNRNWNQLLTEARRANMISRLGHALDRQLPRQELPRVVRELLRAADTYVAYIHTRARHELRMLGNSVGDCGYPVLLLKGAAYVAQGNPASAGRGLSDLDVLVPREHIGDFEARLASKGWQFSEAMSEYDDYYYRELSHELPPMRHPRHQLELDIHHNILQPTHRLRVDARQLVEHSTPLDQSVYRVCSIEDQILHSATHLTMSDELRGGLRDLHDISLLCEHGQKQNSGFYQALIGRAFKLGLQRPLYYTLEFAVSELDLQLPAESREQLQVAAPPAPVDRLMRRLIDRRVRPAEGPSSSGSFAEHCLYLRSHWIRMPPLLLARHLLRKALQRKKPEASDSARGAATP